MWSFEPHEVEIWTFLKMGNNMQQSQIIQVMNDNFSIETHDSEESQVWKTFIYLP